MPVYVHTGSGPEREFIKEEPKTFVGADDMCGPANTSDSKRIW